MDDVKKEPKSMVCGLPCEVYSRVCGYLRPVKGWNKGAQANFHRRVMFLTPEQIAERQQQRINREVAYDTRTVEAINSALATKYEGTPGW